MQEQLYCDLPEKRAPAGKRVNRSPDAQDAVCLQRQTPTRMSHHGIHTSLHVCLALLLILTIAGLQKTIFSLDRGILRQLLPAPHDFQLVAASDDAGCRFCAFEAIFRRQGNPIQTRWQSMGAVGLHGNSLTGLSFDEINKTVVNKQRRFPASQHHHRCVRKLIDGIRNLLQGHHRPLLMIRITENAMQVASTKPNEDGRRTCVEPLALERLEYLVDFVHQSKFCGASSLM